MTTHTVRNAHAEGGTYITIPVSAEPPAGYVALGRVSFEGSRLNYLYACEEAGSPALFRRADGMIVARDRISSREADAIIWSARAATEIFVWAPAA